MRKIFEFKVFDILQDKDNVIFLDKVKLENPDLYTKFINLVGNKGLSVAKQKYKEYTPEHIKQLEKENIAKERAQSTKLNNEIILKEFEININKIEDVLYPSELFNIERILFNDKYISEYFKNMKIVTKYENDFNKLLNNPIKLKNNTRGYIQIDTLNFYQKGFATEFRKYNRTIIKLHQHYNLNTGELIYSIFFSTNYDFSKKDFIKYRDNYIEDLSKYKIDIEDISEIIEKYSYSFSEDFYDEWILKNSASKFNI